MTRAVLGRFLTLRSAPLYGGYLLRLLSLLLMCFLVGCGGSRPRAPVEERAGPAQHYARIYVVQRGDTMYSIAFRYGLDYRRLAAANGLNSPYTIFPGQKLYMREADVRSSPVAAVRRAPNAPQPASRPAPAQTPLPASSAGGHSTATRSSSAAVARAGRSELTWRWPSTGRVIREYSPTVHKGIDIDGKSGDPVYAVEAGKVVYAGTGIVGFGELLIVKHNELYLSAYGHNSRLLVAEGSQVKAGQKIALKGNSGTDKVKLHFEIRRGGKPVDPQQLLPRR
jgi:lipoprotein NlpD